MIYKITKIKFLLTNELNAISFYITIFHALTLIFYSIYFLNHCLYYSNLKLYKFLIKSLENE